ncbi:hypothetical protein [Actinophytocola sediminis]
MNKIDGDPAAMAMTAQQLTAPPMPGSLGRVGAPINPPGLVEGFAMSIVDKMASVAAADYLTRVTNDIISHATNVHHISLEYKWADLASAAEIVGAGTKVANQGISLVKTVTGAGAGGAVPDTTPAEADPAAGTA